MATVLSSETTPPEWKGANVVVRSAVMVLMAVVAIGFAIVTASALGGGQYVKAGLFGLFTVVVVGLGATLLIVFWHSRYGLTSGVRRDTDSGRPATVLTLSAARWTGWLVMFAAAAAFGWWGLLRLLNKVPWTDPAPALRKPAAGFLMLAIAGAAVIACYTITRRGLVWRKGHRPGLWLSTIGIHQYANVDTVLPWESISAIEAATDQQIESIPLILVTYSTKTPGAYRSKPSSVRAEHDTFGIRPSGFSIGAPRVFFALQYYFQHPEARHELGDAASLQRIIEGHADDHTAS